MQLEQVLLWLCLVICFSLVDFVDFSVCLLLVVFFCGASGEIGGLDSCYGLYLFGFLLVWLLQHWQCLAAGPVPLKYAVVGVDVGGGGRCWY